jgi:uncharacterized repeat protein (TIGR03803 family)
MIWGIADVSCGAPLLTTLASFHEPVNGYSPFEGLTADEAGNLYGTNGYGGPGPAFALGTVYKIEAGTNIVSVVTSFSQQTLINGGLPTSVLYKDAAGNLYGTTQLGGSGSLSDPGCCGAIFRIDAVTKAFTKLAAFNVANGQTPVGGMVADSAGNLYGMTNDGGTGVGTVYRYDAVTHAITALAVLDISTGRHPTSGLTLDSAGNMYGTTTQGGAFGNGTILRVDAVTHNVTVLASFSDALGSVGSHAPVTFDAAGNMYGTTLGGSSVGVGRFGSVFRVDAGTTEIKEIFRFDGINGSQPYTGVILDPMGNIYGTTSDGGDFAKGTVFRLDVDTYRHTTLWSFSGADGHAPIGDLIVDAAGNLYGVTTVGGAFDDGTAFRLSDVRWGVPEPRAAALLLSPLALIGRRGRERTLAQNS